MIDDEDRFIEQMLKLSRNLSGDKLNELISKLMDIRSEQRNQKHLWEKHLNGFFE